MRDDHDACKRQTHPPHPVGHGRCHSDRVPHIDRLWAVTIARLGAARRFNAYVAIGATANFASKMLAKATPGEIVLGADAFRQLPPDWRTRFTELATSLTGWTQGAAGTPYNLYRYTGRWLEFP